MEHRPVLPALIDWERARARWADPGHAEARRAIEERARAARESDLRPVTEGGGWGHSFFCPDHVVPLEFDPARPPAHRCPIDQKLWQGEDFDGGWVCTLNGRIMGGLQASALIWRLADDPDSRDYAVEVLMRYAEIYRDLPPYGHWAGKGRVTGQSLEEAVWALGIVDVVDRLEDALDADQRTQVRVGLLEPLAEHLVGQRLLRTHNIECWHLASLAALGVALDDDELITTAVDGPTGLHAQFDNGIMDDGWWVEGSPHYHFYMATAMLHAVRALRERRPDLADRQDLQEMLITPLSMVRDDLSLPAFNDGWHSISLPNAIGLYAGHYEIAHALWGDPRFGEVLSAVQDRGQARGSDAALLYGPDLPAPGPVQSIGWPRRDLHPASGYAVLRDDNPDGRHLVLKYGPHGGGHGHPDKLEIDWWAEGVRLAPDAGSPAYTSPLQGPWFRTTLAHSTIVVDHWSQPPTTGHLVHHRSPTPDEPIGVADAWVGWKIGETPTWGGSWLAEPREPTVGRYGGVRLRRTVLWHPSYLIDLVRSTSVDGPRSYEWVFHHRGTGIDGPETTPFTEDREGGYEYLADLSRHSTPQPAWATTWEVEGVATRIWAWDPADCQVLVANSPTSPPAESRVTTIRRAIGEDLGFASVMEATRPGAEKVSDVSWSGDVTGELVVTVRHGDNEDRWEIRTEGAETMIESDGHVHRVRLAEVEAGPDTQP